jgi:hypothetical protein
MSPHHGHVVDRFGGVNLDDNLMINQSAILSNPAIDIKIYYGHGYKSLSIKLRPSILALPNIKG